MASIIQRPYRDDRFKVVLRKTGYLYFSLTFDDYSAACDWLEQHENKYYKNPDFYYKWKLDLFLKMRKKKLSVHDHIIRPKMRI